MDFPVINCLFVDDMLDVDTVCWIWFAFVGDVFEGVGAFLTKMTMKFGALAYEVSDFVAFRYVYISLSIHSLISARRCASS